MTFLVAGKKEGERERECKKTSAQTGIAFCTSSRSSRRPTFARGSSTILGALAVAAAKEERTAERA